MSKYLVIVEETKTGYSAYSPDLPGCVATGNSKSEIILQIQEAIQFHIEGMREEGFALPEPHTEAIYCEA